jgi:hypothetical protein
VSSGIFSILEDAMLHDTPQLLTLREAPGLFADAALVDPLDRPLFLSLWGRDTALQHWLAELSLPPAEGGRREFTLAGSDESLRIHINDVDALAKETGRITDTVFGPLVHLFLFDRLVRAPDRVQRRAVVLVRRAQALDPAARDRRLWAVVRETCHLPLLDHWQRPLLSAFRKVDWITEIDGFGVSATRIELGDEGLERLVTEQIQADVLRLNA